MPLHEITLTPRVRRILENADVDLKQSFKSAYKVLYKLLLANPHPTECCVVPHPNYNLGVYRFFAKQGELFVSYMYVKEFGVLLILDVGPWTTEEWQRRFLTRD